MTVVNSSHFIMRVRRTFPSSERLTVLSNILRLSPIIYHGLNVDHFQDPLYCANCTNIILSALNIFQEIKNLENTLTVLTSKLKQDMIHGYHERRQTGDNFDLSSGGGGGDEAINLIRKTFVQCWSDLTVDVPKLHSVKEFSEDSPCDTVQKLGVSESMISWQECSSLNDNDSSSEYVNDDDDDDVRTKRKRTRLTQESDGEFDPNSQDFDDEDYNPSTKRKRKNLSTSKPKKEKDKSVVLEEQKLANEPSHVDSDDDTDWPQQNELGPKIKKALLKNIGMKVKCNLCEKSFQTTAALTTHIANIHEKTYKLYCHICAQGFQVNSMLQRHINYVHTTTKKFECDLCPKSFKRSHQLFYHKRVHTGERLICEICGRGFMQPEKLKLHLVIHSGEKRFPCPFCNKFFAIKQYVTNHIKDTHEGKRRGRNKKAAAREKVIEEDEINLKSSYININGEHLKMIESSEAAEESLLQTTETSETMAVEVWRRQLTDEIGVAEIEIAQESQQQDAKFSENYVIINFT